MKKQIKKLMVILLVISLIQIPVFAEMGNIPPVVTETPSVEPTESPESTTEPEGTPAPEVTLTPETTENPQNELLEEELSSYIDLDMSAIEIVSIPDVKLKKALNREIQNATGITRNPTDDITFDDMHKLKTINIYETDITDLTGLEKAINLTKLTISTSKNSDSGISNIEALSTLTNLKELHLSQNCKLTSIEPLRNLINLEVLEITATRVMDFSPINSLTNLKELSCNTSPMLSDQQYQIKDISFLKDMVFLEKVSFERQAITDISPLGNLMNLKEISFVWNNISNIDVLKNLPNLEVAALHGNHIYDFSPINGKQFKKHEKITGNGFTYYMLNEFRAEQQSPIQYVHIDPEQEVFSWENITKDHIGNPMTPYSGTNVNYEAISDSGTFDSNTNTITWNVSNFEKENRLPTWENGQEVKTAVEVRYNRVRDAVNFVNIGVGVYANTRVQGADDENITDDSLYGDTMKIVINTLPEIKGMEDKKVTIGETIAIAGRGSGVSATDKDDGMANVEINTSGDPLGEFKKITVQENIKGLKMTFSTVGKQTIYYRVTDKCGGITTKSKNFIVEKAANKYHKVTFDVNGGIGSNTEVTILENTVVAQPKNPTAQPGFVFSHWSETKTGSTYDFSKLITADITFYAIYEKEENPGGGTVNPTPEPGRTCQDDGYPADWVWNGIACVGPSIDNNGGNGTEDNTGKQVVVIPPTPAPSATPTATPNINEKDDVIQNPDGEKVANPKFGKTSQNEGHLHWPLILLLGIIWVSGGVVNYKEKRKMEEGE